VQFFAHSHPFPAPEQGSQAAIRVRLLVFALAVAGGVVYASGVFDTIGRRVRYNIAALDAATGAATPWNPGTDTGTVFALAVTGSTVYAGGKVMSLGGQSRDRLAAIDAATGAATARNPSASDEVHARCASLRPLQRRRLRLLVRRRVRQITAPTSPTTSTRPARSSCPGGQVGSGLPGWLLSILRAIESSRRSRRCLKAWGWAFGSMIVRIVLRALIDSFGSGAGRSGGDPMTVSVVLDAAGRRRSPATAIWRRERWLQAADPLRPVRFTGSASVGDQSGSGM
jgi:hypothetical protein